MDIDIENCSFGSDHFEEFLNPSLEDDSNPNNLVLNPLVEKAIYSPRAMGLLLPLGLSLSPREIPVPRANALGYWNFPRAQGQTRG